MKTEITMFDLIFAFATGIAVGILLTLALV